MNARSLLAVALAALLAPLAAPAQTRGGRTTARASATAPAANVLSVGGWIGPELGDADGLQLRADAEFPFTQLATGARPIGLSLVGSLGYTIAGVAGIDVNRLKIVPTARFTLPLNPQLSFFGDAGIGLHYTDVEFGDSDVGLMLRLGAGAFFHLNPSVRLGAQFVIDPMFGDTDDTTFAILGGAMFAL